jgi:phytol kinase
MLAALIGKGYGSVHFRVVGERRSLEGSAAFFVATFLLVHVPLLLSERTGRLEAVLIAFSAAALVTCFEAISVWGLDNVFIPYGTYFVLAHFLPQDLAEQWKQFGIIVAFGALASATIRLRWLRGSGAIAVFLSVYGAYNLGGPQWFLAMVGVSVVLLGLGIPFRRRTATAPWDLAQVFHLVIVGMVLLFIHDWTRQSWLFIPYVASLSAAAAIVVAMLVEMLGWRLGSWIAGGCAALLPLLAPPLLLTGFLWPPMGVAAALTGGVSALVVVRAFASTAAQFQCPKCSTLTGESRHCDEASVLLAGTRLWTRNRLHVASVAAGAVLAALFNFAPAIQ